MSEYLLLKWGTLKGCRVESDESRAALECYESMGLALSSMLQQDTDEQKQALCDLIDVIDGKISNGWSGEVMTKDEAKAYVLGYERKLP